jgi:hypothetical protein
MRARAHSRIGRWEMSNGPYETSFVSKAVSPLRCATVSDTNASELNATRRRQDLSVRCWSFLLCVLALVIPSHAAVSVKAQFERANIMTGETVMLNVVVEGGRPEQAETFPAIPGLTVQYQGNSQNITSINGATSVKHILNYAVSASKPGQYTLPSINITVDGAAHQTQPVTLTVTKADPSALNRYAFLRLNVPRQEVYVGEVFPVELQLYVVDAESPQQPQLSSDGFVIHKRLEPAQSQAQVGNVLYTVVTFKMSVSAAKAGKLPLGPAEMALTLKIRARPDPNDLFGVFGRFQRRPVTLTSSPVEMNVLPLPMPVPPEFSGGIGVFDWSVTSAPTTVAVGDPITLKIEIRGRGNLDNLKLPASNWPGFKSYEPNISASAGDPLGIEGSKSFEQVIVPQEAAIKEIPALALAYFDPAAKEYKKLSHPATALKVTPGLNPNLVSSAAPTRTESDEELPAANDIVHIKSSPGPILALAPSLIQQPWFIFLQLIPLAGIVGVTIWRKRQDQLANNPKLRRKLQVERAIQTGLAELRTLATSQQPDAFYALMFRLLQEQLGERLDLPGSAITEAVLNDRLPRRGATADLIQRLQNLFHICNQARYAPMRSDAQLLSLSSDLEKALHDLQQLPD